MSDFHFSEVQRFGIIVRNKSADGEGARTWMCFGPWSGKLDGRTKDATESQICSFLSTSTENSCDWREMFSHCHCQSHLCDMQSFSIWQSYNVQVRPLSQEETFHRDRHFWILIRRYLGRPSRVWMPSFVHCYSIIHQQFHSILSTEEMKNKVFNFIISRDDMSVSLRSPGLDLFNGFWKQVPTFQLCVPVLEAVPTYADEAYMERIFNRIVANKFLTTVAIVARYTQTRHFLTVYRRHHAMTGRKLTFIFYDSFISGRGFEETTSSSVYMLYDATTAPSLVERALALTPNQLCIGEPWKSFFLERYFDCSATNGSSKTPCSKLPLQVRPEESRTTISRDSPFTRNIISVIKDSCCDVSCYSLTTAVANRVEKLFVEQNAPSILCVKTNWAVQIQRLCECSFLCANSLKIVAARLVTSVSSWLLWEFDRMTWSNNERENSAKDAEMFGRQEKVWKCFNFNSLKNINHQ